jgi:hypothetical protein
MKFSAKKGSVGMKSKAERHVCLAGSGNDQRICWAPPRQESQKVSDKASSSGMSIRSRLKRWSSKKLEGDAPRESSEVPPGAVPQSPPGISSGGRDSSHSMAVQDLVSISKTPPAHYGSEQNRSLYLVSKTRSLLLEASDSCERDFWFEQLSGIMSVAQQQQREERRRAKQERKEVEMAERRQVWLQKVLPEFDRARRLPATEQLCWCGLPSDVRGKVWQKCIGNPKP